MILCCGEALIDMLPRETAGGEACFAPYPGGAVFNTAIALGRLGTVAADVLAKTKDDFAADFKDLYPVVRSLAGNADYLISSLTLGPTLTE